MLLVTRSARGGLRRIGSCTGFGFATGPPGPGGLLRGWWLWGVDGVWRFVLDGSAGVVTGGPGVDDRIRGRGLFRLSGVCHEESVPAGGGDRARFWPNDDRPPASRRQAFAYDAGQAELSYQDFPHDPPRFHRHSVQRPRGHDSLTPSPGPVAERKSFY